MLQASLFNWLIFINMQFHRKVTSVMSLFIGIFFILLFFNFSAAGQRKIETGWLFLFPITTDLFWTPTIINWSIAQDSEGIIYYGNSQKGVQTFDGQKVRPVLDEKGKPTEGSGKALVIDSKKTIYAIKMVSYKSIIGAGFGYIEKNKFNDPIYYSLSD